MDGYNDIDDIAYKLYCREQCKQSETGSGSYAVYIKEAFIGSVGCEVFYDKARKILRKKKIDNIKNGI